MNNLLTNVRGKFNWVAKTMLIIAIAFGITGGAAMALDTNVSHHGIGVAAFAFTLTIVFIWIVSSITSAFVTPYKTARGGETGQNTEWLVMTIVGLVSLIITIVALALH